MSGKRLGIIILCLLLVILAFVFARPLLVKPEPVIEGPVSVTADPGSGACSPEGVLVLGNEYDLPVFYTTDGTLPTVRSLRYESSIALKDLPANTAMTEHDAEMTLFDYHIYEAAGTTEARVIRAAVMMPDGTMGPVVTKTYPLTGDLLEAYGRPVASIVADPSDLYDYDRGILVRGRVYDEFLAENGGQSPVHEWEWNVRGNYGMKGRDWERPAYIQMFDGADRTAWEAPCGIRVKGTGSRVYAQRSFNVYFREEYGQKKLEYDLIPGNRSDDGTEYGDTRWRWMMFGTEYSAGQYLSSPETERFYPLESTSASRNSLEDALESCPVFRNAMRNPEFRALLAQSMHRIAEDYMEPAKAVGKLEEYYALWSRWYPDFSARFGAGDEESYTQEFEILKDSLLTRPQYLLPIVDEYCG